MRGHFTLKSGKELEIFLWDDFLDNETYRNFAEVCPIYDGKRCVRETKKKLFKDDNGVYIVWDKEKVYLNNYDYMSLENLIERLRIGVESEDRWCVYEDDVLATFMKESDRIGIVIDLPVYDMIVPSMGFGLTSDKSVEVLSVLSEDRYKKNSWHYKITLTPEDKTLVGYVASHSYYFSDFVSMLTSGNARLVVLDSYKAELEKVAEEQARQKAIEDSKLMNRVKKSLGLTKTSSETHRVMVFDV